MGRKIVGGFFFLKTDKKIVENGETQKKNKRQKNSRKREENVRIFYENGQKNSRTWVEKYNFFF